jgi:CubicO group peptidase (beta-lactamase class C family)
MDLAHATPMRSDAVFQICSMSKPITAAAVLQLYDRGKLRLSDPVSKYIPAFANVKVFSGGSAAAPTLRRPARPITIAHLLTHTSGLTYGLFTHTPVDTMYVAANLLAPGRTLAQFADALAKLPLAFSPGTQWNYGMSLDLLGRVVEVVSGKPFDTYLDDALLGPLGMTQTEFHWRPGMQERAATVYVKGPDGHLTALPGPGCANPEPGSHLLSGGGGLLSTPGDYLRFAQMLLNGGQLDGKRVLKRSTVALMLKNELPPAVARIPKEVLAQGGYGQGFGGAVLVDSAASGLPGSPGIYRWWGYAETYFWIDPKQDLIGMLWTQFLPGTPAPQLPFQRLVYAAVTGK